MLSEKHIHLRTVRSFSGSLATPCAKGIHAEIILYIKEHGLSSAADIPAWTAKQIFKTLFLGWQ